MQELFKLRPASLGRYLEDVALVNVSPTALFVSIIHRHCRLAHRPASALQRDSLHSRSFFGVLTAASIGAPLGRA